MRSAVPARGSRSACCRRAPRWPRRPRPRAAGPPDARADPAQGRAGPLRRGAPSGHHTTPPPRRGPVIRRWLSLIAVGAALRAIGRVLRIAIIAALIIAAAPASVVAAIGAVLAWLRGGARARLYRAAVWCLLMMAVWLAATAITSRSGSAAASAPYHAWLSLWHGTHPASAADIAPIAPPAIPVRSE